MALQISAKDLAGYASRGFCPRCEWVRLHVKRLPFQRFPGIFSTIDRYNKLIIRSYFDQNGSLPFWLDQLGQVEAYIPPPHWSKFRVMDDITGVTITGEADGIFRMRGGSHTIVDYKTAKYTPGQEKLFDVYEAQLNGYAFIGNRMGFSPVNQLTLIYMEPISDSQTVQRPDVIDDTGFWMQLKATVVKVEIKPDSLIPTLLQKARKIHDMDRPPVGRSDCNDCLALDLIIDMVTGGKK